jgi:transposase
MNQRVLDSLPVEQETTIREMFQNHPKRRLRERAMIVILSSEGLCVTKIASILKLNVDTVSDWLDAYEAKGFLGLYDQPIPGRPPRLTEQQEQQIEQWLEHSPREEGYQHSNWTLKLLLHHVKKVFRKQFSLRRIGQIVRKLGFVLIRPRHRSIVPNKEKIIKAAKCIMRLLRKAQEGRFRLFYLDETIATMWATLSRIWARKGTRPEIPMADNHERFVVFSATDPVHGRVHYRISSNSLNQNKVVAFLKQMRQRYLKERLLFILDNARPHIAKSVHKFAQADGNMYLVYLPKYSSLKLNAIERLFKWFRCVVTHNYYFENSELLKQAIRAFFRLVSNSPNRLITLLSQDRNSLFQSL